MVTMIILLAFFLSLQPISCNLKTKVIKLTDHSIQGSVVKFKFSFLNFNLANPNLSNVLYNQICSMIFCTNAKIEVSINRTEEHKTRITKTVQELIGGGSILSGPLFFLTKVS